MEEEKVWKEEEVKKSFVKEKWIEKKKKDKKLNVEKEREIDTFFLKRKKE